MTYQEFLEWLQDEAAEDPTFLTQNACVFDDKTLKWDYVDCIDKRDVARTKVDNTTHYETRTFLITNEPEYTGN